MSSDSTVSESQLAIIWGGFFISVPMTSALWGIGCLQLYQYYDKYWKTDRRWFRLYMLLIWVLDTAHQALVVHFNYVYFVKGLLDPDLLVTLPRTVIPISSLVGLINAMIQAILVRRVWCLSDRNRVLTGLLGVAVITQLTIAIVGSVKILSFTTFTELYEEVSLDLASSCVAMVADTFLAVALVWLLWRARSGLRSTDSLVKRLVTYIVGSSLLTVLCMAISVVASIAAPHSFISVIADMIVPKLYFNCMLASLNARSSLRKDIAISVNDITFRLTGRSHTHPSMGTSGCVSPRESNNVGDIDVEAGQLAQNGCNQVNSDGGSNYIGNELAL